MNKKSENVIFYGAMAGLVALSLFRKRTYNIVIKPTNTVKEFPGYNIVNCQFINIKNESEAKKFAFDSGTTVHPDNLFLNLFGSANCAENVGFRNLKEAQFMIDLLTYFLAGSVYKKVVTLSSSVIAVNGAIDDIAKNGKYKLSYITESTINEIINKYVA